MKRLALRALTWDGRLATIVEEPGEDFAQDCRDIWDGRNSPAFGSSITISFVWLGSRVVLGRAGKESTVVQERLAGLVALLAEGGLAAPPTKVYGTLTTANVGAAHTIMSEGTSKGKLVLQVVGDANN